MWGLLGGSALLLSAAVRRFAPVPARLVAAVVAFGSGVLVSALSSEPMDEAHRRSGSPPQRSAFLGGAAGHTVANVVVWRGGGEHHMRSGDRQQRGDWESHLAVAVLLDGNPEAVVIGVGLLGAGGAGLVAAAVVFFDRRAGRLVERGGNASGGARVTSPTFGAAPRRLPGSRRSPKRSWRCWPTP